MHIETVQSCNRPEQFGENTTMTAWRDFKEVVSQAKVSPQGSLARPIGTKDPLGPVYFISWRRDGWNLPIFKSFISLVSSYIKETFPVESAGHHCCCGSLHCIVLCCRILGDRHCFCLIVSFVASGFPLILREMIFIFCKYFQTPAGYSPVGFVTITTLYALPAWNQYTVHSTTTTHCHCATIQKFKIFIVKRLTLAFEAKNQRFIYLYNTMMFF